MQTQPPSHIDLSLRATTFEPNVARNKFPYFLPKKGSRFKSQRAVVAMTWDATLCLYRVYYRPVAGATVENLILIPSQTLFDHTAIKQSILAAIAELLIFLLCLGDSWSYRVYYRAVAVSTDENLILIPSQSDLCEWTRLSQSYQLIKQSILAAIADLLIFFLCCGDLFHITSVTAHWK